MAREFVVQWRPSGGRGEYEYKTKEQVDDRSVTVRIPLLDIDFATDVSLKVKDGKHRLRRANPSDRKTLNLPSVVTVACALPKPKRELSSDPTRIPLADNSYVIDKVYFDIVSLDATNLVVSPTRVLIRGELGLHIDVQSRIKELLARDSVAIKKLIGLVKAGANDASALQVAATNAHAEFPVAFDIADHLSMMDVEDPIVEEYVGTEGKQRVVSHRRRERDPKLVKVAKKNFKVKFGTLFCELCGIDFSVAYPSIGDDFIEAHHRVPLSQLDEQAQIKPDDLMMVCSNCHRMIHKVPDCDVKILRRLINQGGLAIVDTNLAKLPSS